MTLKLIIGNKNYSSWSMRPWVAMKAAGIAFEEILIPLDAPDFKARVGAHSLAGKVPVLVDGEAAVWESIAIIEHLSERFPDAGIWPKEAVPRAFARSLATQMHGGFAALRSALPMNLWRPIEARAIPEAATRDIAAITAAWRDARAAHGAGGDFLFGAFGGVDAMYAPVASRIRTYAVPVDPVSAAYVEAVHAHPAFVEWKEAGLRETGVLPEDEIDWPVVKRV